MNAERCVWYAPADYAGLTRRLAASLADAAVVILLALGLVWVVSLILPLFAGQPTTQSAITDPKQVQKVLIGTMAVLVAVAIPYHLLTKRTHGGSVGYRLAGIRLVMVDGSRPTAPVLLKRFLLGVIGPAVIGLLFLPGLVAPPKGKTAAPAPTIGLLIGNLVVLGILAAIGLASYWSIPRSPRRQAQHDRFAGTWVIRAGAQPAGTGRPLRTAMFLGLWAFPYWDVEPDTTANDATA